MFCIIGGWKNFTGGFPSGASGKEPVCQCRRHRGLGFDPWVGKIPWIRKRQPTPVFLPGEFHGQRSLVGYMGLKELDTTEHTAQNFTDVCTNVNKTELELLFPESLDCMFLV